MFIVNGKSSTGPNAGHLSSNTASITSITYPGGNAAASAAAKASNQYQFQLERASLVSAPVPSNSELDRLTGLVAQNNAYSRSVGDDRRVMSFWSWSELTLLERAPHDIERIERACRS